MTAPRFHVDLAALERKAVLDEGPRKVTLADIPRSSRMIYQVGMSKVTGGVFGVSFLSIVPATSASLLMELPDLVGLALWAPAILAVGTYAMGVLSVDVENDAKRRIRTEHELSQKKAKQLALESGELPPPKAFKQWLRDTYGLKLKSKAKAISWTKKKDQQLQLLTPEGALLKGRLVNLGDGRFELRKAKVGDTAEDPYFTVVGTMSPSVNRGAARPALTAQRETPNSITVERETSS